MSEEQENPYLIEVGSRIRRARDARGLKLHEFARLSGISAPALSLIETGKRDLRLTTLRRIAAALRVALIDLLEEGGSAARAKTPPADNKGHDEGYDLGEYS